MCWADTSDSGTMAGMEHVAPDAAIVNGTNISLAREGGILTAPFRPKEVMAELRATLLVSVSLLLLGSSFQGLRRGTRFSEDPA